MDENTTPLDEDEDEETTPQDEFEITLKIPGTDFTGLAVLNGIGYLEKKLLTETPDSDGYIGCRDALKVLRAIMAKIDEGGE